MQEKNPASNSKFIKPQFTPCGKCNGGYIEVSPLKYGWARRPDLDGRDVEGYVTDQGTEFFQPRGQQLVMATPCNCMRTAYGYKLRDDLPEAEKVVVTKPAVVQEREEDVDSLGWLRRKK